MAVSYNNPFGINNSIYGVLNPQQGIPTNQKAAQFVAQTTNKPAFSYTVPGYVGSNGTQGVQTSAPIPQVSYNNPSNNSSSLSLRDQMLKGLIPWDDNLLNSSGGQSDPYASLRNDISSSWDNYLSSLNDTSGYLDTQRTAQENIANSQYDQGVNVANTQKAASLRDIANTTRNAFQAGNNYLGSLGAGDSSAANQYAFAINKQAGKQTGDLNNFVNSQVQQLGSQRDQQLNQIASWFAQQQQTIKQQMAQGLLSKGQDLNNLSKSILDQAIAATNQIKTNAQNQQNALLSWAASNSTNLGQLRSNIAGIPQAMGQMQTYGGNASPISYGGAVTSQKTDMFGQPLF